MVPEEVRPNNVIMMKDEDFFDFSAECDKFLNTTPIKISTLNWIRLSRADFPLIKTRQSFNDLEMWTEHRIFKKGQSLTSITNLQCLQRLERRPVVPDAKKRDLLSMLDFLDEKYHAFYRKICA